MTSRRMAPFHIFLAVVVLALTGASPVIAQDVRITRAELSGVITDPAGALVPDVKIVATHSETKFTREVATNSSGIYVLSSLPPGSYVFSAEYSGFRKYVQSGLILAAGDRKVIDIKLEIGEVTNQIEVTAAAPLVNQVDATLGENLEARTVNTVPINGRDFTQLLLLQPGAILTSNYSGQSGRVPSPGTPTGISYNGAHDSWGSTNVTLDGIDITEVANGIVDSNAISVESVQEVNIDTTNMSAEVGRSSMGKVTFISKSGSNDFHGSLFEFWRGKRFQANEFFSNASGQKLGDFSRHQNGGSIGGPILKDKIFFFYVYEQIRNTTPSTYQFNAPTQSFKNTLPPVLKQYFDLVPNPQQVSSRDPRIGVLNLIGSNKINNQIHAPRVDFNLGRHQVYFRYSYNSVERENTATNGGYEKYPLRTDNHNENVKFSWNVSLNPTTTNEFGYGLAYWNVFNDTFRGVDGLISPAARGRLTLQGEWETGAIPHNGDVASDGIGRFISDNFRLVRGKHQISVGAELRRVVHLQGFDFWSDYSYETLDDLAKNSPLTANNRWGAAPFPMGGVVYNGGAYLQDDFKVSSRLTLNLGVRWDWEGKTVNDPLPNGRVGFLKRESDSCPTCPNGTPFGHAQNCKVCTPFNFITPGTDIFDPVNDKYFTRLGEVTRNGRYKNISPRLGAALDLFGDSTTVLRGGFGISILGTDPSSHAGFRTGTNSANISSVNRNDVPGLAFPVSFVGAKLPPGARKDLSFDAPNMSIGYTRQWNVSLQRALGGSNLFQLAYVGNHSEYIGVLGGAWTLNPFIPNAAKPGGGDTVDPCCNVNLWGRTSYDNYHSLQATFKRNVARGLSVNSYYAWSHALHEWAGGQGGYFNRPPETSYPDGISGTVSENSRGNNDVRHNFLSHWLWDVPRGNNRFVQGWQLAGIWNWRSGLPAGVSSGRQNRYRGTSRANVVAGVNRYTGDVGADQPYLNRAAFAIPPSDPLFAGRFLLGDSEVRPISLPGAFTFDLSVLKTTTIKERHRVEFRAEIFNLFNHMVWGGLNTTLTSSTFGRLTATQGSRQVSFGIRYAF